MNTLKPIFTFLLLFASSFLYAADLFPTDSVFHYHSRQLNHFEAQPEEALIRVKALETDMFYYAIVLPNGEEMEFMSEPVGYIKLGNAMVDLTSVNADTVFIAKLIPEQQVVFEEVEEDFSDLEGVVDLAHQEDSFDVEDKLILDKFVNALLSDSNYTVELESQGGKKADEKDQLILSKIKKYLLDHWVDMGQIDIKAHRPSKAIRKQKKNLVAMKMAN